MVKYIDLCVSIACVFFTFPFIVRLFFAVNQFSFETQKTHYFVLDTARKVYVLNISVSDTGIWLILFYFIFYHSKYGSSRLSISPVKSHLLVSQFFPEPQFQQSNHMRKPAFFVKHSR